jgi:ligand-binding sensor domain-containing protein
MTFYHLFLLFSFIIFTSCIGQNNASLHSTDMNVMQTSLSIGDTVKQLGNHLLHVFEDKNHHYWFGSSGEGIYRYDGKKIIHYTMEDGLCNPYVINIQEDKSGNLYFNTRNGISKFDGKTFSTLNTKGTKNHHWQLHPDDLWFVGAQDSGVVYRYDGNFLHRLVFPKTKAGDDHISKVPRSKFPNANYSPYDVYTIYHDKSGNVWFGTSTLGVCRYDSKSFMWISEADLGFDVETGFGIRSILEDSQNHFWFSNTLSKIHFSEHIYENSYGKVKGIGSLDGKTDSDLVAIMSMLKGQKDEIWMVTYNSGVWSYDGKKVTHYPITIDGKSITLFSIYKDSKGDLWIGTHENGAFKFNGTTFEKFVP